MVQHKHKSYIKKKQQQYRAFHFWWKVAVSVKYYIGIKCIFSLQIPFFSIWIFTQIDKWKTNRNINIYTLLRLMDIPFPIKIITFYIIKSNQEPHDLMFLWICRTLYLKSIFGKSITIHLHEALSDNRPIQSICKCLQQLTAF